MGRGTEMCFSGRKNILWSAYISQIHKSWSVACWNSPLAVQCWLHMTQIYAPPNFSVSFSVCQRPPQVWNSPPEVLDQQTEKISPSRGRPPDILMSILGVNTVNSPIINDPNLFGKWSSSVSATGFISMERLMHCHMLHQFHCEGINLYL